MNRRKTTSIGIIVVFVVCLLLSGPFTLNSLVFKLTRTDQLEDAWRPIRINTAQIAYTHHDPISITSNQDFSVYGFPGNGSLLNPYLIDNYFFNATGDCISIFDTDAHFIIQDCLFIGEGYTHTGIYLENVTNGVVRNNTIDRKNNPIHIAYSSGIVIVNNNMTENHGATFIDSSSSNEIMNNTIYRAYLLSSSNNTLVNNTVLGTQFGVIDLVDSPDNKLSANIIMKDGIRIMGSKVEDWRQNVTSDNLVNGRPILYLWNRSGEVIDGSQYSLVFLANCTNLTLENSVVMGYITGIALAFSSNCTLRNNTISSNYLYGISFKFSSGNTVMNNTILDTNDIGVFLSYSDNNLIMNNTLSQNGYGIYFHDFSNNNSLVSNIFSDNIEEHVRVYGLYNKLVNNTMMGLGEAVSIRGQHTTVIDNTILGNSLNVGIRIRYGSHSYIVNNRISGYYRGITLGDCYNNTMEKNIISENGYGVYFDLRAFFNTLEGNIISRNRYGVYFNYDSHNNKVTNNTITWNELFGVYCAPETYENQMYLNVFANNDGPNANDDGSGNYWNTTGFGNYWSNYNGTGVYYIPGTAGSIDYHPSEYNETVPSTTDTSSTIPTGIGGGPFDPIVILVAGIGIVIVLVIVLQYRKRG